MVNGKGQNANVWKKIYMKKSFSLLLPFTFLLLPLNSVHASAGPAFAAECVTAFAGAHTGTETALTQLLDLAYTMIFQNISPTSGYWFLVAGSLVSC